MSEDRAFVLLQNFNGRGVVYYLWGVGMRHAARFLSHILSSLHADPLTKLHSASAQDWPDELLEISEVTGPLPCGGTQRNRVALQQETLGPGV